MSVVHRRLTAAERAELEPFVLSALACYPDALGSEQFLEASAALHRADIPYTWATVAALIVLHRGEATKRQAEIFEHGVTL